MPKFEVKNERGLSVITLDGDKGSISAGRQGEGSYLVLKDKDGGTRLFFGSLGATLVVGGNGEAGAVHVCPAEHQTDTAPPAPRVAIQLDAATSTIRILREGKATIHLSGDGHLIMNNSAGVRRVHLDGPGANLWLGGKGEPGDLMLFNKDENDNADHTKASIWISGQNGDIVLRNGDCAEEFDIEETSPAEPGTVLVANDGGRLEASQVSYDTRVAGVISGAGDTRPGLVLGRRSGRAHRVPVALVGRVFCKADASAVPIRAGDLLTTSSLTGHAMRALDPGRAFGAVLGKSLRALPHGTDLIPVLVALQ